MRKDEKTDKPSTGEKMRKDEKADKPNASKTSEKWRNKEGNKIPNREQNKTLSWWGKAWRRKRYRAKSGRGRA